MRESEQLAFARAYAVCVVALRARRRRAAASVAAAAITALLEPAVQRVCAGYDNVGCAESTRDRMVGPHERIEGSSLDDALRIAAGLESWRGRLRGLAHAWSRGRRRVGEARVSQALWESASALASPAARARAHLRAEALRAHGALAARLLVRAPVAQVAGQTPRGTGRGGENAALLGGLATFYDEAAGLLRAWRALTTSRLVALDGPASLERACGAGALQCAALHAGATVWTVYEGRPRGDTGELTPGCAETALEQYTKGSVARLGRALVPGLASPARAFAQRWRELSDAEGFALLRRHQEGPALALLAALRAHAPHAHRAPRAALLANTCFVYMGNLQELGALLGCRRSADSPDSEALQDSLRALQTLYNEQLDTLVDALVPWLPSQSGGRQLRPIRTKDTTRPRHKLTLYGFSNRGGGLTRWRLAAAEVAPRHGRRLTIPFRALARLACRVYPLETQAPVILNLDRPDPRVGVAARVARWLLAPVARALRLRLAAALRAALRGEVLRGARRSAAHGSAALALLASACGAPHARICEVIAGLERDAGAVMKVTRGGTSACISAPSAPASAPLVGTSGNPMHAPANDAPTLSTPLNPSTRPLETVRHRFKLDNRRWGTWTRFGARLCPSSVTRKWRGLIGQRPDVIYAPQLLWQLGRPAPLSLEQRLTPTDHLTWIPCRSVF